MPDRESYSPEVVFRWARASVPGLRIFATVNEVGERVVMTKVGEEVLTARSEEELVPKLLEQVSRFRGWETPGRPTRNAEAEAEIVQARVDGLIDYSKELARELAMRRAGRAPGLWARSRMSAEGWRRSSGPRPGMLGTPPKENP